MKNTMEFKPALRNSSFSNGNVVVKVAESKAELEDIFRLRYKIYVEQMHWDIDCADHAGRRIEETLDKNSLNIGAWVNGKLAGCVRLLLGSQWDFGLYKELFRISAIEDIDLKRSSYSSKLAVDLPFRNSRVNVLLQKFCYRLCLKRDVQHCFVECEESLVPYYEKFGFRAYMESVSHPKYGKITPLVIKLDDIDHLTSIRSPVAAIYHEVNTSGMLTQNAA